jgi:hypothetical protein
MTVSKGRIAVRLPVADASPCPCSRSCLTPSRLDLIGLLTFDDTQEFRFKVILVIAERRAEVFR